MVHVEFLKELQQLQLWEAKQATQPEQHTVHHKLHPYRCLGQEVHSVCKHCLVSLLYSEEINNPKYNFTLTGIKINKKLKVKVLKFLLLNFPRSLPETSMQGVH